MDYSVLIQNEEKMTYKMEGFFLIWTLDFY